MSLPSVTAVGTLTADPELRYTNAGKAVASVNIATNSRRKNPTTGAWEDGDTTYLRGNIWGEYAENVANTLTKGNKVVATGQLKQRSYEKDGQKRTVFELEIDEIGPTLRWTTAVISGNLASSPAGGNAWGATEETPSW